MKSPDLQSVSDSYRLLRGPAWRLALAAALPENRLNTHVRRADEPTRALHQFRLLDAEGGAAQAEARRRYPHVAAAYRLEADEDARTTARILALGGCPSAEIAQRLARDEATIRRWEALFFDVRHGLEATGWIRWHVVAPEERRGDYARAARFKAAAAGGRAMARALLDLESRAPLSAGEKLFMRKLAFHLRMDEVMARPMETQQEKIFFVRWASNLQRQRARLQHEKKKLAQRCLEARRKHEAAEQRRKAKAAERAERERAKAAQHNARVQAQEMHAALRREWYQARLRAADAREGSSALAQLRWHAAAAAECAERPATAPPAAGAVVALEPQADAPAEGQRTSSRSSPRRGGRRRAKSPALA
jgi:hypothetical protein